ncbi:Asp-tRNA(Asn)/Glu-tRNA(Gln) amidotransferase subunit GatA [Candidatus Woesearchaeota archaeon]|nr:Asp-tRNA(Asn)/Glu-tRNA(Gln) amidotransferase subunit GatA [Candidatus Woesearchaeota archaeon]
MTIKDHIKKVQRGEIDIVDATKKALSELKKTDNEFNYMNIISEELALSQAKAVKKNTKGKLAGLFITAKDAILVAGVESRGGSKILDGYTPPFSSTAIKRCVEQGAIILGKTAQDEFGFGAFCTNVGVGFKTPKNPFDKNRATGGSSGGAGGISQLAGFPHIALGESTGGSIVNPASFCGVYGLCPTYGRVSRYGLLDYGNSLDKIGPMGKDIGGVALVLEVISGRDKKDSTTLLDKVDNYSSYLKKDIKGMKIGIIKETFGKGVDNAVEKKVEKAIEKLKALGAKVEKISLPTTLKYGISTYYIIATSEASTNLAKYCGMKYGKEEMLKGNFNEYFSDVRAKNLGEEAKRRIMLGTFARMSGYRDAYYIKALKARTKIIDEYKSKFKTYDALISPTTPMLVPTFDKISKLTPLQNYMADIMTVGPNLAGLPHINIPVGFEKGTPVGMMITADHLKEGKLFSVAKALEK